LIRSGERRAEALRAKLQDADADVKRPCKHLTVQADVAQEDQVISMFARGDRITIYNTPLRKRAHRRHTRSAELGVLLRFLKGATDQSESVSFSGGIPAPFVMPQLITLETVVLSWKDQSDNLVGH
jgi:hypothetical protein